MIADVMNLRVVAVEPDASVQAAIRRMLEENVGAVVVTEGSRLVGIFTERDVLRLAGEGASFLERRVGEVMTRSLLTATPDDDVLAVARLIGDRHIRHVPVVEGDNLLGVVGIRELLRSLVERLWRERSDEARAAARELLERTPARGA